MSEPIVETITVKEGEKEMIVLIPQSDDRSYNQYLREAEIEKTKKQLSQRPIKARLTEAQRREAAGALKEYAEFMRRKRGEHAKKYF